jgi:hypothetical protein
MRFPLPLASAATLYLLCSAAGAGAELSQGDTPGLPALELRWHQCVRQAYANQPAGQSKAASQRRALHVCKEQEDAFVAAVLAAQIAEEEARWRRERPSVTSRARAWAASVTAYVFDPVASWLSSWVH